MTFGPDNNLRLLYTYRLDVTPLISIRLADPGDAQRIEISKLSYISNNGRFSGESFYSYIVQFKRVTMLNKDNSHDVTLNKTVSTSRVSTNEFIEEARMTNHSDSIIWIYNCSHFGASTNNSWLY